MSSTILLIFLFCKVFMNPLVVIVSVLYSPHVFFFIIMAFTFCYISLGKKSSLRLKNVKAASAILKKTATLFIFRENFQFHVAFVIFQIRTFSTLSRNSSRTNSLVLAVSAKVKLCFYEVSYHKLNSF